MSKRHALYARAAELFRDAPADALALPADEAERKELVHSLFGAALVECVDGWVEEAGRVLGGNAEFAGLTPEQRESVLALVGHTAYGALFSQCVALDQFSYGALEVRLVEGDEEGKPLRVTPIAGPAEDELHHAYYHWAERFGDRYDPDASIRFAPATYARGGTA
jgi:hypothetical protein